MLETGYSGISSHDCRGAARTIFVRSESEAPKRGANDHPQADAWQSVDTLVFLDKQCMDTESIVMRSIGR